MHTKQVHFQMTGLGGFMLAERAGKGLLSSVCPVMTPQVILHDELLAAKGARELVGHQTLGDLQLVERDH